MNKIYFLRRGAKIIFLDKKILCQDSYENSNSKYCLACAIYGVLPLEGATLKDLKKKVSFKSKFLENLKEIEMSGAVTISWNERFPEESIVYFHEENCLKYASKSLG